MKIYTTKNRKETFKELLLIILNKKTPKHIINEKYVKMESILRKKLGYFKTFSFFEKHIRDDIVQEVMHSIFKYFDIKKTKKYKWFDVIISNLYKKALSSVLPNQWTITVPCHILKDKEKYKKENIYCYSLLSDFVGKKENFPRGWYILGAEDKSAQKKYTLDLLDAFVFNLNDNVFNEIYLNRMRTQKKITLQNLKKRTGLSAERIRQKEVILKDKIATLLKHYNVDKKNLF